MELWGTTGNCKMAGERRKCTFIEYKIFKSYYIGFDQIGNITQSLPNSMLKMVLEIKTFTI